MERKLYICIQLSQLQTVEFKHYLSKNKVLTLRLYMYTYISVWIMDTILIFLFLLLKQDLAM